MYKEPWCNIKEYPAEHATELKQELSKELNTNHPLYGVVANVLAKREDRDDILIEYE